jgi:VIT1/CCC1 family predicted Fe2+/Mn2+ transporter
LITVLVVPRHLLVPMIAVSSLLLLATLGALAARIGGARMLVGSVRVAFWGALAMAATAGAGALFGATG